MRQIFTLVFLLLSFWLHAQNNSGIISFEEKINLRKNIQLDDPDLLAMIPEFKTNQRVLLFNADASVYREPTKEEKEEVVKRESADGNMTMVFRSAKNVMYKNATDNQTIEQKEFMGRTFLIEGELPKKEWKITGEQKQISGFMCMKAELKDTLKVEAWFTPQIPVSSGPSTYANLPGLILEVIINEDERVITAKNINLTDIHSEAIVAPSEGKKVTREKFLKIVEEKTKEMQEEMGGNGGGIRIIRN